MVKGFWGNFVTVEDPAEAAPSPPVSLGLDGLPAAPPATPAPTRTAMDWTLEEVIQAGGAETGRNSAETALKLKDSLAAFPDVQQVAMVRALDAADDTWAEATVKADAQKRVQVLEKYLTLVAQDETTRVQQIMATAEEAKKANDANVAQIEAAIAKLQAEKEQTLQNTAAILATAQEQAKAVSVRAEGVKSTVNNAISRYKSLLSFFSL